MTKEEIAKIAAEFETSENKFPVWMAFLPFGALFLGFVLGYPIFFIGVIASILTIVLAKLPFVAGEGAMLGGVSRIATPLVATIAFLFMSSSN